MSCFTEPLSRVVIVHPQNSVDDGADSSCVCEAGQRGRQALSHIESSQHREDRGLSEAPEPGHSLALRRVSVPLVRVRGGRHRAVASESCTVGS